MSPKVIRLERGAKVLVVEWPDGKSDRFPWGFLRSHCPSAGEKAAREQANPLAVLKAIPSAEIVDVRMVGAYAVSFTWADGHNVGIYTWEYLRELSSDPAVG